MEVSHGQLLMQRSLKATEIRFLRRMLRPPWTAKMANRECGTKANLEINLIKSIRKRQLSFFGHKMRKERA